jgi:hypothetical protein
VCGEALEPLIFNPLVVIVYWVGSNLNRRMRSERLFWENTPTLLSIQPAIHSNEWTITV